MQPDFIGANFFQGVQAFYDNLSAPLNASYIPVTDEQVQQGGSSNPDALLPEAIRSMLDWVDRRYHHLPIIVTETGVAVPGAMAAAGQCHVELSSSGFSLDMAVHHDNNGWSIIFYCNTIWLLYILQVKARCRSMSHCVTCTV